MNGSSGGPLDVDDLPLSDLAYGLEANSARGTDLRQWASTILMLSDVQIIEAESADEDCY